MSVILKLIVLLSVANTLKVERVGAQHQAGSDSLVTGRVFFTVYDKYFSEGLDDVKYSGNQSEAT